MLNEYVPREQSCTDTFTFVEELKNVDISNKYMSSFDINSLFTNIHLTETTNIATDLICNAKPDLKITQADLVELFQFATTKTIFLFPGMVYD